MALSLSTPSSTDAPTPVIRLLDPHTINQIAAGEVVERPASVVKELVENALDAGARRIEIDLEQSGRRLIRVADDGCGMGSESATLALQRHATSKIRAVSDLNEVVTMGFRGEALPSIASVSRLTLSSAERDGSRWTVRLDGPDVLGQAHEPGPKGTTIVAEDLFHNTPARLKFLKSDASELSACVEAVSRHAVAFPEVAFVLRHGGRVLVETDGSGDLEGALASVWGRDMVRALAAIDTWSGELRVRGFVSPPTVSRPTRAFQWAFVNRRPVRSKLITAALDQAYRSLTPERRHALALLLIDIDPARVDVNVSPTKSEVRFQNEGGAFDSVRRAIKGGLLEQGMVPSATELLLANRALAESGVAGAVVEPRAGGWAAAVEASVLIQSPLGSPTPDQPRLELVEEETSPRALPDLMDGLRVLGQMDRTFILAENATSMLIVDQHVAHERVLYEKLRDARMSGPIERQPLLSPETLHVSRRGAALIEDRLGELHAIGFELEPFGPESFLVRAVPVAMRSRKPIQVLRDLAEELEEGLGQGCLLPTKDEVLILCACKMAVKAGDPLGIPEMQRLMEDLAKTENPYFCPHGRPITLATPKSEIARRFKR